MIHLDTNYVIGLVTLNSPLRPILFGWVNGGEKLAVSAVAWSEFLNGPVKTQQIHDALFLLDGRIIPFSEAEAEKAAELFNHTGRKRGAKPDCFIAAAAIQAGVPLATRNTKDFQPFVPLGLRLA
jgi:predicted nucleic acid-binding protein